MTIINPLTAILPVNPAMPAPESREERAHDLRLHQMVRATVAEGGDSKVLLEFAGRRTPAETSVGLQTGKQLDLQVVSTSPRIELRIVEDPVSQRLGHSVHLLGGKWDSLPPVRQLMVGGNPLFDGLSPQAQQAFGAWMSLQARVANSAEGKSLKSLIRRFGLFLEADLAKGNSAEALQSLKSALLEVLQSAGGSKGEVEALLDELELFQLCRLKLSQQGVNFFPVPLPQFDQAFMIHEEVAEGEGDDSQKSHKISLYLALQGLGDMRVDFLYDDEGLLLRFVSESEEKSEFIGNFRDELNEVLKALPLQGVSFASGAQSPAKSLLEKIHTSEGFLDTRV